MTIARLIRGLTGGLAAFVIAAGAAQAAGPAFPPLTGRVVDAANVLPPQTEADLTAKLQALETQTGRQLVVATVPSLQDYPIEDFGYQLGRAWGIGAKGRNDGAILLVAPADRQVRIEVGYGLEPVLTDALSSTILQRTVLPRFRAGDVPGGIVGGTAALIQQLSLPDDQAKANVSAAAATAHQAQSSGGGGGIPLPAIIFLVILFLVISRMVGGRGGGWLLPMILMGGRGGGGSFGGGGGGGFGGGGGSFGGGGASGRW